MTRFFFLFLLASSLLAEEEYFPSTVDYSFGQPSAIAGGCINVINGHFVDYERDLTIAGPEPLTLDRSYSRNGWATNLESQIDGFYKSKTMTWIGPLGESWEFKGNKKSRSFDPTQLRKLYVNTGFGDIGGLTNAGNLVVNTRDKKTLVLKGYYNSKLVYRNTGSSFQLRELWKPNCCIHFSQNHVGATTRQGVPYASIQISDHFKKENSRNKKVQTHYQSQDGKHVYYNFQKDILVSVERTEKCRVDYTYIDYSIPFVKGKNLPGGRYVKFDYYRSQYVTAIHEPAGPGGVDAVLYTFKYEPGKTIVTDANSNVTTYHFNQVRLINKTNPYFHELMIWDDGRGLLREYRVQKDDHIHFHKVLDYDGKGNVLCESLYGDGLPGLQIHRQYDVDCNLIYEETPSQIKKCTYQNKQIASRTILSKSHPQYKRETFQYDDWGTVSREEVDDGYEKIVTCTHRNERGLPDEVIVHGHDYISRNLYSYDSWGRLNLQRRLDQNGNDLGHAAWGYDPHNNCIFERDFEGRITHRAFDLHQNCVELIRPDELKLTFEYDTMNRLVVQKEHHADSLLVTTHAYDLLSNRTATTNWYGQTTQYEYDALNRKVATIHPDGTRETVTYNALNHIVTSTNANGYTTRYDRNWRGNPTRIYHADGSQEGFIYDSEGQLLEHHLPNGSLIAYTLDWQGRILKEQTLDANRKPLNSREKTYSAFHLLSETEYEGNLTTYEYDGQGRLKSVQQPYSQTRYTYDTLGRTRSLERVGVDIQHMEYDLLGRVLDKKVFDTAGTLLTHDQYTYNTRDQVIAHHTPYSQVIIRYDTHGIPLNSIDAEGYGTHSFEKFDQGTRYQEIIDPKGIRKCIHYNIRGVPSDIEILDSFGNPLQKIHYTYDPCNRPLTEVHDVFVNGLKTREVENQKSYDIKGHLIHILYGCKTPEQRSLWYTYNASGQKETETRSDGRKIHFVYDSLGRLSNMTADDLQYHYTYDRNHNLLTVQDGKQLTQREYDFEGNMTFEKQANGYASRYTYEPHHRLLTYNEVHYAYQGDFLKKVTYKDHITNYTYDSGRLVTKNNETRSYTPRNLISQIKTPSYKEICAYDEVGNLVSQNDKIFTYDLLNQLNSEPKHTYTYDSLNNRVISDNQTWNVNSLNQLTQTKEGTFSYDLDGNLLQTPSLSCKYDVLNRLIEVKTPKVHTTYTYDPFNRRQTKTVNGKIENYYYMGQNEVGSENSYRVLGVSNGAEIGGAVYIEHKGSSYIPTHDHNGNIVQLSSSSKLRWEGDYSAFGIPLQDNPIPWGFSSKRLDPETGWIYFGCRYYDPAHGRWTTSDPIGDRDGPNLYAYLQNSPLTALDLYGLYSDEGPNLFDTNREKQVEQRQKDRNELGRSRELAEEVLRSDSYKENYSPSLRLDFLFPNREKACLISIKGFDEKPGKDLSHMNGIFTSKDQAIAVAKSMANLFSCNVTLVYNPTHDGVDIIECLLASLGITTEPVALLQQHLSNFFKNAPSSATAMVTAFSQGCIHTKNAMSTFDPILRKRVEVLAVAPGGYIRPEHCKRVVHLRNASFLRDFVPHFDIVGAWMARDTIMNLPSAPGTPWHDHSFLSPTYDEEIRKNISNYMKN